jgi:hypothetical protein
MRSATVFSPVITFWPPAEHPLIWAMVGMAVFIALFSDVLPMVVDFLKSIVDDRDRVEGRESSAHLTPGDIAEDDPEAHNDQPADKEV